MKLKTKHQKATWAIAYCVFLDKSTEFMIQFIQDVAKCDFDKAMDYMLEYFEENSLLEKEVDAMIELIENNKVENPIEL